MASPTAAAAAASSPGAHSTVELDLEGRGQIPQSAAEAREAVAGLNKWDGDSDSDEDDAAAAALRSKYGLAGEKTQEEGKSSSDAVTAKVPQESKDQQSPGKDFSWDDAGTVQELTQKNVHLMAQIKDYERTVQRLEETLIAVKPPPGLEAGTSQEAEHA